MENKEKSSFPKAHEIWYLIGVIIAIYFLIRLGFDIGFVPALTSAIYCWILAELIRIRTGK